MNNSKSSIVFRIVLFLASLPVILTGINITFGGIFTLGLQGDGNFAEVTNKTLFLSQDSHIRFLGGVWLSTGILFLISAFYPLRFQSALKFSFIAVFIGGLARFSQMNTDVILSSNILPSLLAELIGMPVLYYWLLKLNRQNKSL